MNMKNIRIPNTTLRNWLYKTTEPHILYPGMIAIVLAVIWVTTLHLIKVEHATAEHTVAVTSIDLLHAYESQVLRTLREIDLTLMIIDKTYEFMGEQALLPELKERHLSPSARLFTISFTDARGNIMASTRPSAIANVADQDYFQSQRQGQTDVLSIGLPQQDPGSGEWQLYFSRRLDKADGSFAGIVIVSVPAYYFVSGYEPSALGEHGLLGLISAEGVFLVRRSGKTISAGDRVDYAALPVRNGDEADRDTAPSVDALDGVLRYASAHELYEFPLTVIVGLSADEQLAGMRRSARTYLWWASAGSVLLILFGSMLGYLNHQLALSRRRTVEEHIANAARVEYLAFHDSLTTLPNRSLFSKLLGQSLNQTQRYNRHLAVLFIDLDHFKKVNDTLGHEAGDQLLQEVAARLRTCLRASDTVARLGGDEFIVLLPELDEEKYAATVAQKILSATAQVFILQGQEFRVTASVGISTYPQDGMDEQTLIKNADTAMYHAKEAGKNSFQFYSEKMNASSLERHNLS